MDGKLITFFASDNVMLSGFLTESRTKKRCMIYVHGLSSAFYRDLPFLISKELKSDTAVLSINTRGHDPVSFAVKFKGRKRIRTVAGADYEKFEDCIYDIKGAIDAAKRLGFKEIYLCGHSTGCQKITYYQYKTRDRRVTGLILLAPADDYNLNRKALARNYNKILEKCKRLVGHRKGSELVKESNTWFSAGRLLSLISLDKPEARLFNYDGPMKEFNSVRIPIFAAFGSREEYALKPVKKYLEILAEKTGSGYYSHVVIDNADHSFRGKEAILGKEIAEWLG